MITLLSSSFNLISGNGALSTDGLISCLISGIGLVETSVFSTGVGVTLFSIGAEIVLSIGFVSVEETLSWVNLAAFSCFSCSNFI